MYSRRWNSVLSKEVRITFLTKGTTILSEHKMPQKKDAPTSNQATNETAHYYHYRRRRRYYQFKIRESRTFAVRLPGTTAWPDCCVTSDE